LEANVLGVDNTTGCDPQALKAAGFDAVFRYLSNSPGKNLVMSSPPYDGELRGYLDAGVAVVLNWEATGQLTTDAHPGDPAGQGRDDAMRAQDQATRLGYTSAPIYFSIDYDCGDWAGLTAYFQGVASVLGGVARVGAYGGGWVIKHLLDNGLITYAWQTLAWSGLPDGTRYIDPRIHVLQRIGEVTIAGAACDVDEIRQPADFGQIPRPNQTAPTTTPGVDVTPDECRQAIRDVLNEQAPTRVPGSTVTLGLGDCIRNTDAAAYMALHALTDPIPSAVPGSTYSAPPSAYWANADSYGYALSQQVPQLVAAVQALEAKFAGAGTTPVPAGDVAAELRAVLAALTLTAKVA